MRSARYLLRRCTYLRRMRAELLVHVQHTRSPYNLSQIGKKPPIDPTAPAWLNVSLIPPSKPALPLNSLIDFYDSLLNPLELFITRQAKQQDHHSFYLLRSFPGLGEPLCLVLPYGSLESLLDVV